MAKKTAKCVPWLTYVLNETLPAADISVFEKANPDRRRIKLIDGSCIKQVGLKGETLRIHMSYDLTLGCMDEVLVTDHHTAESFEPFTIEPGSIYIADAGYGRGRHYKYIVSRQGEALFRVTPNHISLAEDSNGQKKIDMVEKLDTQEDVIEFKCYIHTTTRNYVPARVIASRLPEDKFEVAIKRKKRTAQRRQTKLKSETLIYAQWVILMTSLDERYSAEDILALYRARWQIELLFKRIKQFFKVTRIKAATVQHSKALVLLWLIAWSLTEREVIAAEIYLRNKKADVSRISTWTMCSFFYQRFKAIVNSLWLFCYNTDVDLTDIYKRLRNHKSSRLNQYAEFSTGGF